MLYMVIERFKEGAAPEIYRRFHDGDFKVCWQLMQTDDFTLFDRWIDNWRDLIDFEIVPVHTSAEVVKLMSQ